MYLRSTLIALLATVPLPAPAQHAATGAVLYADFCAACHGDDLHGGGPLAGALTARPSDLTALQGDGDFPILRVARQIDGRDPLLAHGGEMPLFGQWFEVDGPHVPMTGSNGQPIMLSGPTADLIAFLMEMQQ